LLQARTSPAHSASKFSMPVRGKAETKIGRGAIPPESLAEAFPPIRLPIHPPYPPADARSVEEIPDGDHDTNWLYEPKWDGFRCIAFRSGNKCLLQSKAGQPLGRYFPELDAALLALQADRFVLDGEIVIFSGKHLSFDDLLLRIHPAESRIRKLSSATPATFLCFDLLVEDGKSLVNLPLAERRQLLQNFFRNLQEDGTVRLSPASPAKAQAERWMQHPGTMGLDGVIAKRLDEPYRSGERTAMVKIKRLRTADCVVGGFRYASKGGGIGSLLLGLYNDQNLLDHVGFTSSYTAAQREDLKAVLEPHIGAPGFTGHAPGGPSRWSNKRSTDWQPLHPKLVCEVQYDHFSGGRFRHGTKFLRWRPEKQPGQCTFSQLQPALA
jgi:ATP-dependent DNA ligase